MQQESRFFRNVWRFNALALAGVLVIGGLAACAALAIIIVELTRERSVADLVDARPEAESVKEELGALTPLGRTGLLWAPVTRRSSAALGYSSKGVNAVIDRLIYDPQNGARRFLLGRRPGLVLSAQILRPNDRARAADGTAPDAPDAPLAITFIDKDGNGDGRLSRRDPATLAIASATGESLSVIAAGVEVLGVRRLPPSPSGKRAVATIREKTDAGEQTFAILIDLQSRRAIRRDLLPKAPTDLE